MKRANPIKAPAPVAPNTSNGGIAKLIWKEPGTALGVLSDKAGSLLKQGTALREDLQELALKFKPVRLGFRELRAGHAQLSADLDTFLLHIRKARAKTP